MTASASPARSPQRRVRAYVAIGIALGLAYVAADTVLDRAIQHGPLLAVAAFTHNVIDRVVPIVAGALAGIAVQYVQLRSGLARDEARRADELQRRLQKVERDQAVWVVAAATLHEVKNPLHTIGLLLDEIAALATDSRDVRDVLEKARAQIARADASLASLRVLAQSARPKQSVVSLDEVAAEVARDIMGIAARDRIEVTVRGGPVKGTGDPAFVRVILENLIANSLEGLRQRGDEGKVDIAITTTETDASVRVHDDGPGIDQELQAEMFEPLASNKPRGLGLGLAIARALARTMRGDLALVTEAGWATTFELRLPVAK
jgi:signal transduction histidine kinase